MNRRNFLKGLAGLASCPCAAPGPLRPKARTGAMRARPARASGMSSTRATRCAPSARNSRRSTSPSRSAPSCRRSGSRGARRADTIVNNGHTIQVNFAEGSSLTVGSDQFALLQFHFHRPSEHRLDRRNYAMETHFVHRHATGKLAVVGVLMTSGRANPAFNKVVTTMPGKEGPPVPADAGIDPNGFLPAAAQLLPLRGLAHDAAVQRDGRLAAAHRADLRGAGRHRRLRQALPDERPPGAERSTGASCCGRGERSLRSNSYRRSKVKTCEPRRSGRASAHIGCASSRRYRVSRKAPRSHPPRRMLANYIARTSGALLRERYRVSRRARPRIRRGECSANYNASLTPTARARRRSCRPCSARRRPRRTSRSAGPSPGRAAPGRAC